MDAISECVDFRRDILELFMAAEDLINDKCA